MMLRMKQISVVSNVSITPMGAHAWCLVAGSLEELDTHDDISNMMTASNPLFAAAGDHD